MRPAVRALFTSLLSSSPLLGRFSDRRVKNVFFRQQFTPVTSATFPSVRNLINQRYFIGRMSHTAASAASNAADVPQVPLDRAKFTRTISVVALRCDVSKLGQLLARLRSVGGKDRRSRAAANKRKQRQKQEDVPKAEHSASSSLSPSTSASAPISISSSLSVSATVTTDENPSEQTNTPRHPGALLTRPGIQPVRELTTEHDGIQQSEKGTDSAAQAKRLPEKIILLGEHVGPDLSGLVLNASGPTDPRVVELHRFIVEESHATIIPEYELLVSYANCTADEVLSSFLPLGVIVPSSFELAGHIAHLNLRPEHAAYKRTIGQVILDKTPARIRTVVSKIGSIHADFRTFDMELLAGDDDYAVELTESNCTFRFDYRRVYWNSRLQMEHDRLWKSFEEGCIVADMMAGIGPFAIPAAKHKNCHVFANDLNPDSFAALQENARINKVTDRLIASNMDAREFIRDLISRQHRQPDHIIMNLPASAVTFLDVFIGLYRSIYNSDNGGMPPLLPRIHCYGFTSDMEDPARDMQAQCERYLMFEFSDEYGGNLEIAEVRDVAPNKRMYRVSFDLPPSVAYADQTEVERAQKRRRT